MVASVRKRVDTLSDEVHRGLARIAASVVRRAMAGRELEKRSTGEIADLDDDPTIEDIKLPPMDD